MPTTTMVSKEEIEDIGWIIHGAKKRKLGPNFVALLSSQNYMYCDPILGWTLNKPNRIIEAYDPGNEKDRLGMEAIFNFEDDKVSMYLFSLCTDGTNLEWTMDGFYSLFKTDSGYDAIRCMNVNGKMVAATLDEFSLYVFKGKLMNVSSVLVNRNKIFPKTTNIGYMLLHAINRRAASSTLSEKQAIDHAVGQLDNSIISSAQISDIMRFFDNFLDY